MRKREYTQMQEGKNASVIFAYNDDTAAFFENDYFPSLVDDVDDILRLFRDAVDNYRYFGDWYADDDHYWFGFKSGKVVYVGDDSSVKIRKNVFVEDNLLFVINDNSAESLFWVNGWAGIEAMQKATNWFDIQNMLELEEDWI